MSSGEIFFLILTGGVILWAGGFVYWYRNFYLRRKAGPMIFNSVFLEVIVPKEGSKRNKKSEEQGHEQEKEDIAVAEQLFATLSHMETRTIFGFFRLPASVSLEIASVHKKISFYINCPGELRDLVEKQIHAQYPEAEIDEIPMPRLMRRDAAVAAVELGLRKKYFYPIKSYKFIESDPLNPLTNSLSKLGADESGAIQLVITPAARGWRMKINRKAHRIQKGEPIGYSNPAARFLGRAFELFGEALASAISPKKKEDEERHRQDLKQDARNLTPMQQEAVKRLEEKAGKQGFEVNIRVVVVSGSDSRAGSHLRNILSSFMQYTQEPFNGFRVLKKSRDRVLRDFLLRTLDPRLARKNVLNTEELASIFHLPGPRTETPNIKWLQSKRSPAPTNISEDGPLLGVNVYRGIRSEIRISREDRARHMYIVGRTGTGKSEFMKNLARQDMAAGEGIAVIDPHGELVEDLLRFVPKERADDVVLFEPFDMDRPMGLNMLEVKSEEEKDFAVQEMIAIFYKLFPPEMIGPMFEHNMRNVMLTLMADRESPGTIAEIPRMFTDTQYQRYKLSKVSDPVVRSFWEQEMAKTSDFHKSEMLGYLISKVGRFVENEMMRNIIGQSHSAFDFRAVMDEGKILLINLSKGKTGEVNSMLLGLIIVSKLQMAALARADLPEGQRRDFYLYIDEFQNFVTDSVATILSEARKYRLALIMAHQYIGQLVNEKDTKVRDAVFGNAGTMVAFRVGVEDAEVLAKEFDPVFNEYDLINIDRFNAYVKLMIDGTVSRPFNMGTLPPPESRHAELAEAVKKLAKLKYGRPRAEVREEILKRSRTADLGPAQKVERTL